jgi:hypothetical protein
MRLATFIGIGITLCGVAVADTITYDIQKAGYRFDQYDQMGPATYEAFVEAFREFPWRDQVGKSNGGSEPTISVKNRTKRLDLWVSAAKHETSYVHLVGVVYLKQKRPLFGLGRPTDVRWVEIYVAEKPEVVEGLFRVFFSETPESVISELKDLPMFAEMEAAASAG